MTTPTFTDRTEPEGATFVTLAENFKQQPKFRVPSHVAGHSSKSIPLPVHRPQVFTSSTFILPGLRAIKERVRCLASLPFHLGNR